MALHIPNVGFRAMLKEGAKVRDGRARADRPTDRRAAVALTAARHRRDSTFPVSKRRSCATLQRAENSRSWSAHPLGQTVRRVCRVAMPDGRLTGAVAVGMNKIIINHLDKLFVTTDAATIVKELEVQHPAARMLVMASERMQHEVGDGTNLTLILAGTLLSEAASLVEMGLAPSDIISGYDMAKKKALALLDGTLGRRSGCGRHRRVAQHA